MLFRITLLAFFVLQFSHLKAHPGIGLVYDGNHTIYYTDLKQVWKLNINTGEKEIALPNIHTHELALDNEGNLYGEHYWYIESRQQFQNYIWRLTPDGIFKKIRENKDGENEDYSFARDHLFKGYYFKKSGDIHSLVRENQIGIEEIAQLKLSHPTWKYISENGNFYFADYPSVFQIKKDNTINEFKDIAASRFPFSTQRDHHRIYGIWTDQDENIYVAVYGGRVVRKIDSDGNISNLIKSSFFWSPVNGVFDGKGNLWLMESKLNGKIRVRKIFKNQIGEDRPSNPEKGLIFIVVITALFLFKQYFRKMKSRRWQAI